MRRIVGIIKYVTVEGDAFDALAFQVYKDEKMAHEIIKANPKHSDVLIFEGGVKLNIPLFENSETPATMPPWR